MILEGFASVFLDPVVLALIAVAVAIGIIFGSIPGLTATMAIVMFLPVTYRMTPIQGISTLVALYIGGISGGLVSAILLNIPGTPSSVATCFDGRPMAENGEAGKALGTAVVFSFVGSLVGIALLMFISPMLASIAIKFGAYEYTALAVMALSLVVALTGRDMTKGFVSAILGAMLATVGLAPIDSKARYTFGLVDLTAGFKLLVLLIGLFAITEIIKYAESVRKEKKLQISNQNTEIKGFGFSFKEFIGQLPNSIRSALLGVGIGILPGIGGAISGTVAYTVAKNTSKYPEKFGTGIMDGVVASESANNGTIGGAMIPLLSLGIPGDAATAMLLGGLMVHNVAPGPLIFDKSGSIVYAIFFAMILASLAMLVFELFGMKQIIKVLKIPSNYLLPVIVVLTVVGAIGDSNRIFDVWGVLLFGLMGYGMIKAGIPTIPMILGFILGPMFESNVRKMSQLMNTDSLINHPIAIVFYIITVLVVILSVRGNIKEAKMYEKMKTL
jgi:putative tricarboxylic transport membrane protein